MGLIKEHTKNTGLVLNYWNINSFRFDKQSNLFNVEVRGYHSKDIRERGIQNFGERFTRVIPVSDLNLQTDLFDQFYLEIVKSIPGTETVPDLDENGNKQIVNNQVLMKTIPTETNILYNAVPDEEHINNSV